MLRVLFSLFFTRAEFFVLLRNKSFLPCDWVSWNGRTVILRIRAYGKTVKRKTKYACPVNAWKFLFHPIRARRYLKNTQKASVPGYFVRELYKEVKI